MDVGLFLMPCNPPERPLAESNRWNVDVLERADALGYREAWLGEHFTVPWEPIPAPDLLLAQALRTTEHIRLGPGAHIVPFHHPGILAMRLAYLDHASGGRLNVAFTQGTSITDWRSFRPDAEKGEDRARLAEGIEIILKYWTEPGPWRYEGRYWTCEHVGPHPPENGVLAHHLDPLQRPHPPIAMAGITADSMSLRRCGERGWWPLSLNLNPRVIADHWATVQAGAAAGGRTADRRDWRVVKEVFVAETDAQARRYALDGNMGRYFREFNLPLFSDWGFLHLHKDDLDEPDSAVDIDYLCDRWLVGSPETVTRKLTDLQERLGGFGTLLVLGMDYADDPEPWFQSMRLLVEEVVPNVPGVAAAPAEVRS